MPLARRPAFAYGLCVREIFGGAGGWTAACLKAGLLAEEPVELYEDPARQKGPRPEHDISDAAVRDRLLKDAASLPGPGVANIWQFGTPCASFCDYGLLNSGTRTCVTPQGDGSKPAEMLGNLFADFTAKACQILYANGKEFCFESSAPSGRYPKIWDLPNVAKMRRATGAVVVPMAMCAWGLAPPDHPEQRYRKYTWWLVSPGLVPWAFLLARQCPKNHVHAQLKGANAGSGVPRTRTAGNYAPRLCEAWATVLRAAYASTWPRALVRDAMAAGADPQGLAQAKSFATPDAEADKPRAGGAPKPGEAEGEAAGDENNDENDEDAKAKEENNDENDEDAEAGDENNDKNDEDAEAKEENDDENDEDAKAEEDEAQATTSASREDNAHRCGEVPGQVQNCADKYMSFALEAPKGCTAALVEEAVARGNRLLGMAGNVETAARALGNARDAQVGNPTIGMTDPEFLRWLEPDHAAYLCEMANEGVPSRRRTEKVRVKAKAHSSACEHLQEMYDKLWEDSRHGAILWCSDEVDKELAGVHESPLGRVPKMNPDRTLSAEGRPIHDMRTANLEGSKYDHPPALQPRHRQVARQALWWQARHPKVPRLIAKRDVNRAFKWHALRPEDASEFATRLPALGGKEAVVAISLVMTFGWVGSPGEYMIHAWAAKHHHASRRPPDPGVNDTVAFSSHWLMDDGVVLEVAVGVRPWLSLVQLEKTMTQVWGPGAVNEDKRDEDGSLESCQLLWGLHMDANRMEVSLPEPKCVKAVYLLALPALQPGERKVPLKLAQELTGTAQYWATAHPAINPELAVLDRLLRQADQSTGLAQPKGTQEEVDAAWKDWDRTLELFRVMFSDSEAWQSTFTGAFAGMLSLPERLALLGQASRVRRIGGDATLDRLGSIDWGNATEGEAPSFIIQDPGPLLNHLERAPGCSGDFDTMIALLELLAYVVLAAWVGLLVLYVTDNQNTKTWLQRRRAGHPVARHLLRVLARLEAKYCFHTGGLYARTYHNITADWITREVKSLVEEDLLGRGWTKLEPPDAWGQLVDEACRGLLRIPGEEGDSADAARLHLRRRSPTPIPRGVRGRGLLLEWGEHLTPYGNAWRRIGGDALLLPLRDGVGLLTKATDQAGPQADCRWLTGSFTLDPCGQELQEVARLLAACRAQGVCWDLPRGGRIAEARACLEGNSFEVRQLAVLATEHGDVTARSRIVLLGTPRSSKAPQRENLAPEKSLIRGLGKLLLSDAAEVPLECWLQGDHYDFLWDARIATTCDRRLPWPAGHAFRRGSAQRTLVHDPQGPGATITFPGKDPAGPGNILIRAVGPKGSQARRLTPQEVWWIQGGSAALWNDLAGSGHEPEELLRVAARMLYPRGQQRHSLSGQRRPCKRVRKQAKRGRSAPGAAGTARRKPLGSRSSGGCEPGSWTPSSPAGASRRRPSRSTMRRHIAQAVKDLREARPRGGGRTSRTAAPGEAATSP